MTKECFQELGTGSCFAEHLYERAVSGEHFLRMLEEVVEWDVLEPKLIRLYRGEAKRGRPTYNPVMLLKILVLPYPYDLSECQVEAYVNDSLSAKWFLGLAVDERAPDHSTLTKFKRRIARQVKEALLEELLQEVVLMAMRKGVEFGSIRLVDSTHTWADVNVPKDKGQQRQDRPPRDGGAKRGG